MFINNLLCAATGILSTIIPPERLDLFFEALSISGKGLLGIFIVTIVIILLVVLLNKLASIKKK